MNNKYKDKQFSFNCNLNFTINLKGFLVAGRHKNINCVELIIF